MKPRSACLVGRVVNGVWEHAHSPGFLRLFHGHEGKLVSVTVDRYAKKRSNALNNYYHGVIVPIVADYIGTSHEETHESLKALHNTKLKETPQGTVKIILSTAKLTDDEFWQYCERCRRWAAEFLGVYIPDPNEGGYFGRQGK